MHGDDMSEDQLWCHIRDLRERCEELEKRVSMIEDECSIDPTILGEDGEDLLGEMEEIQDMDDLNDSFGTEKVQQFRLKALEDLEPALRAIEEDESERIT